MTIKSKIEALLFTSTNPISLKKLAKLTEADQEAVSKNIDELANDYHDQSRGIHLVRHAQSVQLVTKPELSKLVAQFFKDQQKEELTKPSLETLTIVAYRGPVSKAELDTIRGVNCSLILRNLLIKGLIESVDEAKSMTIKYQVTFDFLRYLGLSGPEQLPDYDTLHNEEHVEKLLQPKGSPTEKPNQEDIQST
ncbi:MAG: SMC-Scp complex subunit ScpB [Patescibacteria group bacterium]